ncbi:MAG: MBL fold metallo-hydrolase [Deltaproteobacteria bacterium]|nr:MBL fold metallo-hydrolase [Deltaproteobacteria bacterium]
MITVPYRRRQVVAPGVTCTFLDAGHVLGSAIVVLDIDDDGAHTRIAFTGDLGRHHLPILRDPEVPDGGALPDHGEHLRRPVARPIEQAGDALAEVIERTCKRGGKVIIPSFALERAGDRLRAEAAHGAGQAPNIPVYVDSPLTVSSRRSSAAPRLLRPGGLRPAEQRRLALRLRGPALRLRRRGVQGDRREARPAIIISASGMCEGGRVLHHLRAAIGRPENTVVIVGFQAEHTLGRRLVEKRDEVRIFGLPYRREAEVAVLNGFSAHADQAGLLDYAESVRRRGKLRRVILVHGEPGAQAVLMKELDERGFPTVDAPSAGQRIRL